MGRTYKIIDGQTENTYHNLQKNFAQPQSKYMGPIDAPYEPHPTPL